MTLCDHSTSAHRSRQPFDRLRASSFDSLCSLRAWLLPRKAVIRKWCAFNRARRAEGEMGVAGGHAKALVLYEICRAQMVVVEIVDVAALLHRHELRAKSNPLPDRKGARLSTIRVQLCWVRSKTPLIARYSRRFRLCKAGHPMEGISCDLDKLEEAMGRGLFYPCFVICPITKS